MSMADRLRQTDWLRVQQELLDNGHSIIKGLLDEGECTAFREAYAEEARYRKQVIMARHGYGRGEYRYFGYPLPPLLETLRRESYPPLARAAGEWASRLGRDIRFPERHDAFLAQCHACGQTRPTPLILKYGAGDYNRLHQDLYGEVYFPFQMALLLSEPGTDFDGGEFVLVENRPRMQSRPYVVPLAKGDAVIFAVNERPQKDKNGYHKVSLRHGVSDIRRGNRYTLGVIYHDAL